MKTFPNLMIVDKHHYEHMISNGGHIGTIGPMHLVAVYDHDIDMYILIKSRLVEITDANKMLTPFKFEAFLTGYLISHREHLQHALMREKAAA